MILFFVLLLNLLPQTKPFTAKVVGISDGDSFTVLYQNQEIRVRLNHIDCPEKRQPFGTRAKEETAKLIFGKTVEIRSFGKDRYGRVLAEVFTDGKCVNKLLVSRGLAWHFKKYSKSSEYAMLEIRARKSEAGLWKEPNPVPPWEWRKKRRSARKR